VSYSQLLTASRAVAATLRAAAGEVKARTRNQQIADDGASQEAWTVVGGLWRTSTPPKSNLLLLLRASVLACTLVECLFSMTLLALPGGLLRTSTRLTLNLLLDPPPTRLYKHSLWWCACCQ